ncbi:MAG: mechanosensitive ion channel [Bacteroidales bacterium]|nr:mechanosensitive ion channel [Bacteroidales bacterium]
MIEAKKETLRQLLSTWASDLVDGVLSSLRLDSVGHEALKTLIIITAIIILGVMFNWLAKKIIIRILSRLVRRSSNNWDDALLENKVFDKLSHLAPVLIVYLLGPAAFSEFPGLESFAYNLAYVYIVVVAWMIINSFLNAVFAIYDNYDISKTRPIKGYIQILKILFGFVGVILILSIILDQSPMYFLTGLGAMTAILMLIFKDTILGFVAGVQITTNNLIQIGDWIEMPKYNADGDVIDITLHTVLVQNWDRTITSIPAYAMISESFKNWRGMVESGGRRIKRSVYIDLKTVKLCDDSLLLKFEKIHLISDYVKTRRKEIEEHNAQNNMDLTVPVNGRQMTNVGTFRAYIYAYLKNHSRINHEMTCMVRQLEASDKGLPLEIYAFTNDTAWVRYESIQSDIFDHIFAVAPFFELELFQLPTKFSFNPIDKQ